MQQAVGRLARCLKPGGQLLLRDYGRYDMAQLRFKKGTPHSLWQVLFLFVFIYGYNCTCFLFRS